MRNSFELALDHMGRKMGGLPVEVIYEDDGFKPEVGKQKTEKLIESDKVDFIAGYIWSNVLLASLKPVVDFEDLPGHRQCRPVAGRRRTVLADRVLDLVAERPDAAGDGSLHEPEGREDGVPDRPELCGRQGHARGRRLHLQRQDGRQELTTWPSQLDFSAELAKAKAANPDAIFVFYPGKAGVQFLTQYAQAGLKGKIPLYTAFTIDELSLPLQKDLALGVPGAQEWVNDLPNEANKKFVADYIKKYPGKKPSFYGAQSYDAANLIASAVNATKGNLSDKDGGAEGAGKGRLQIGARQLQVRQQPHPDPELLSAGRGEGRQGRLRAEDRRHHRQGQPGRFPRQVSDEVIRG